MRYTLKLGPKGGSEVAERTGPAEQEKFEYAPGSGGERGLALFLSFRNGG